MRIRISLLNTKLLQCLKQIVINKLVGNKEKLANKFIMKKIIIMTIIITDTWRPYHVPGTVENLNRSTCLNFTIVF